MKKFALIPTITLALAMAACSRQPANTQSPGMEQSQSAAPGGTTGHFTGEIMDSACAAMGGHGEMGKSEGAKNCTLDCVKMGSKFVLYDAGSKTTYQLDDQSKPQPLAGERVVVTGTLDPGTKTIHVESITKS